MKKSIEPKPNIVHRLLNSTLKFKKTNEDNRSKSPVYKFQYGLPKSFFQAVDNARINAGNDILFRLRHRSGSSSSSSSSSSPHRSYKQHQIVSKICHSFSTNDIDKVSIKKVQFRRTPREPVKQHHHLHHHKMTPIRFSPRPPFQMMMNTNFMMINRCSRPPPVFIQRQQIFPLRFR